MKLNDLDLNKLHTFFSVAESGGVAAAARRLSLTPSAVSQRLSALEAALEVQLFHRLGRRIVPTREGELLHRRLREYQAFLLRTLEEIANEEREVRGLVRLGLFLGFSRLRLARLVERFTRAHPGAGVRVLYASQDELDSGLLENRFDFVLSFEPRSNVHRRIRSQQLFEQELVLVAASRFRPGRLRFSHLSELPIVDYYQGDPLIHRWIAHHFQRPPPPLRIRCFAASTDLVLELVLGQVGLAVLPRDLADRQLRRRRLRVVRTGRSELRDAIWLNELSSAYPSPRAEAFRQAVAEALRA